MSLILREFEYREFYCSDPLHIAPLPVTNWAVDGNPYKPAVMSMSVNKTIRRRFIYAYLWAKALDTSAYLACEIGFYLGHEKVFFLPLTITNGFNLLALNVGAGFINGQNLGGRIDRSLVCAPLGGGLADQQSITVALRAPLATGLVAEPTQPIVLQPYELNFECSLIQFDVLGWSNYSINDFRAIMISTSPTD